jgi:hypothetical protein
VFSLTSPGPAGGLWTETILYTFHGGDGESPNSYAGNLAFGPDGSLYGVAPGGGGAGSCGYFDCGILYQLTPPAVGDGSWTETILHAFSGLADGTSPIFAPVVDSNGVLYGVAFGGAGSSCDEVGCGVVYQYIPVNQP